MANLENIYKSIKENKITAYNHVASKKLSVCFNFIEVPHEGSLETDTAVMTVSIMYNRQRKNALELKNFAKLMTIIEGVLDSLSSYEEQPYLVSLWGKIPNKWYSYLGCHRVFLVPLSCISEVMELLFCKQRVHAMTNLGIHEVSLVVSTEEHDIYAQVF